MNIDDLMKIKADFDRPRSAFDHLHDAALRASRGASPFNRFRAELLKASRAVSPFNSAIESSALLRHMDVLNSSVASRLQSDPILGLLKESAFFAAQSQIELSFRDRVKELTEGFSARSAAARISENFLSGIKIDTFRFPNFHSLIETETETLMRSIRTAAEIPSASALASLSAAVNATSFTAAASLMRGFSSNSLLDNTKMMERLFEPSIAYSHFAARTLEQISNPMSDSCRAAVAGSLLMADEQAMRIASLITTLTESPFRPAEVVSRPFVVPRRPVINRYRFQREELLSREEEIPQEADYETLAPLAPSANLFETALRCLELVGLCDETNQTCTGETVFKLTPMVLISFSGLLGTVAHNRATLAQVVENLYIVLYESAGTDKLRYLERSYLTRDECEIIWRIKHLRNKWLSHDADHGSDSDIKESRRVRMDALWWLGVERMSSRREDYAHVHRVLLERVEEFLSLLLTRIAGATDSIN
jgi:hypothetical protein